MSAQWAVRAQQAAADDARFTGKSDVLESKDLSLSRRRFEPGARSAWHSHDKGQLIYVEEGRARTQKKGQPIRELGLGDSDYTGPNVVHWHGAVPADALRPGGRELWRRHQVDGEGHRRGVRREEITVSFQLSVTSSKHGILLELPLSSVLNWQLLTGNYRALNTLRFSAPDSRTSGRSRPHRCRRVGALVAVEVGADAAVHRRLISRAADRSTRLRRRRWERRTGARRRWARTGCSATGGCCRSRPGRRGRHRSGPTTAISCPLAILS